MVHNTLREGDVGRYHNILREDELFTYPQGGWARELYYVLLYTLREGDVGSYHNILREDELFTYPQGGWARELYYVLLYTLREDDCGSYHGELNNLWEDELDKYTILDCFYSLEFNNLLSYVYQLFP